MTTAHPFLYVMGRRRDLLLIDLEVDRQGWSPYPTHEKPCVYIAVTNRSDPSAYRCPETVAAVSCRQGVSSWEESSAGIRKWPSLNLTCLGDAPIFG